MRYYFKKCDRCGFPIQIRLYEDDTWKAYGHMGDYDKPHRCMLEKRQLHPEPEQRHLTAENSGA
jgi:hypothetical protein